NSETAEGVEKCAGRCDGHAEKSNGLPMLRANQRVGQQQVPGKHYEHEKTCRDEAYSGEVKDQAFKQWPDGQSGPGIEVAREVPGSIQEVANGGAAIPA